VALAWLEALGDRVSGADFVIRRRAGGGVRIWGRVPGSKRDAVRSFFEGDLEATLLRVRGRYGGDGQLRLEISGALDAGGRQRVRNFLVATLG
jgi:hypothetical protein